MGVQNLAIAGIGADEPIKSAASELEAAHQFLDAISDVFRREAARELVTRIRSLTRSSCARDLAGQLLEECVRIASGSSCDHDIRQLVRSIESGGEVMAGPSTPRHADLRTG